MVKNCSSLRFTEAYSNPYTQGMILFIIVACFMLCEHEMANVNIRIKAKSTEIIERFHVTSPRPKQRKGGHIL